tara:strand:- start:7651 stop:7848 length:198 start_codon:yes stop_codon:yes gene_type:complete
MNWITTAESGVLKAKTGNTYALQEIKSRMYLLRDEIANNEEENDAMELEIIKLKDRLDSTNQVNQ